MTETAPKPAEAVVRTAGVTSHVYDSGEVIGHVLLLDLDGESLIEAVKVADHLSGVAAVLESSEGSHHVWCLDVRPFREQTTRALSYHAVDDGHVGASWRRGHAVLRVCSKVKDGGERYKERPTVVHISPSGAEGEHSAAHAAMLRSLIAEQGEQPEGHEALTHSCQRATYVGDAEVRLDQYETLTDGAKDALREV